MPNSEILKFCIEKGLLLDKEVLNAFSEISDINTAKLMIERIKQSTSQRIITKEVFNNKDNVSEVFFDLPEKNKENIEKLKIKLGLNIEISKEISKSNNFESIEEKKEDFSNKNSNFLDKNVKIYSSNFSIGKKLCVDDFVNYFRNRFSDMRNILQDHSELNNLVSINKLSGNRQNVSLIGLISEKRITKNKNMLLDIEDLTGKIRVLINKNKPELYSKAEEIALDSVIGFKGSGNKEIFFANDVIFPDAILPERKKADIEEYAIFIGDMHIGSSRFMEKNFLKFIDYLNKKIPNTPEVEKIKYVFIVGDLVAGVGVYPNQEYELALPDLESHFEKAAELLGKIRSDIKIIICPGNHDGVRLMEPQPFLNEKYAWPIYNLKNVTLTTNPSEVNIASTNNFKGFNVLLYHGFSFFHYADNIVPLMMNKAAHNPDLVMKFLLKNRHLAPTHSSTQYFPAEKDSHLIKEVPDIFVSGHTHKSSVCYYNNILCISVSSWEEMTPYMEKRGAKPDFCKVPLLNLKTRAIKILDFE